MVAKMNDIRGTHAAVVPREPIEGSGRKMTAKACQPADEGLVGRRPVRTRRGQTKTIVAEPELHDQDHQGARTREHLGAVEAEVLGGEEFGPDELPQSATLAPVDARMSGHPIRGLLGDEQRQQYGAGECLAERR